MGACRYLLILLLFYSSLNCSHQTNTKVSHDDHWDILIFTQQWPWTVCEEWKEKDPSHSCDMPNADSWSIHGLWPTKYGTMGPFFCNRTARFDPQLVRPIEAELTRFWTNIEHGTSTYSFWAHEWTKHGTCAAIVEDLNNEFKYFNTGLEYFNKYNLTTILSEADIVPSNNKGYDVVDIVNAVRVHLGVNPVVECRKEKGQSNLVEIRVCFTKKLELTDCDGVVHDSRSDNVLTNCDRTQPVMYLPYKSNSIIVELYRFITWLHWFTL